MRIECCALSGVLRGKYSMLNVQYAIFNVGSGKMNAYRKWKTFTLKDVQMRIAPFTT